ncbi:MAG: hypothetical protein HY721_00510 [Planctomycetes bacterium]|nr:hypothetical protein [Planctomycetota bacterium]
MSPAPAGRIAYDAASGELSYTPDPADRTDFTVTFTASPSPSSPIEGKVLVSPLPSLPPEDTAIHFEDERIDPESNDYVRIRVEQSAAEEVLNQRRQKTRKVSISGAWLVFESGSEKMSLYDDLEGDTDVKELTLYADRVVVRSPLHLPQATVRIYARELRFEGDGLVDVTQAAMPAPVAVHEGLDGAKGPDMWIQVERFHSDPTAGKRLISRGMRGLDARGGHDGGTGLRPGTETCGTHQGKTIVYEACNNTQLGEVEVFCGSRIVYGEDAVPYSKPGEGGDGGTIWSTLDLSLFADFTPGPAGQKGRDTEGGVPVGIVSKVWAGPRLNPCSSLTVSDVTGRPGRDATSPLALRPTGFPGQVSLVTDPGAWLHPISVQSFLRYLKDLYLGSDPLLVRKSLAEYSRYIDLHKGGLPTGDEKSLFDQLQGEIQSILGRIDSHLDYFGNPLTWVPMLSFEANLAAFTNEIDRAVPVLYLAYWIEAAAGRAKSTRDAIAAGKQKLEEEIDAALDAYEAAQDELPVLQLEADELEPKLLAFTAQLRRLEAELERRAQENVEDRHKVPWWRKAVGVLGAITKVIPVGQPALGYVGVGLDLLSRFDPDHPTAGLEGVPDVIKTVRETNYLACLKEKQEEGTKDPKKDRQARIARLNACASLLATGIKNVAGVFKSTGVAVEEVKAELEKLRAGDPLFLELTRKLEELGHEKQLLAERLASTLQTITGFSALVTEKLLAIQKLDQNLSSVLAVLDHQALLHVVEMGREARDRLLRYQYLMAKAYQYRILKTYTGSWRLGRLFDELKALAEHDGAGHELGRDKFEVLKRIYLAELGRIADEILTDLNANAPQRSAPVSFRLAQAEIRELNETGRLVIDLGRRNLFGADEENLRIVGLRTQDLVVRRQGELGGTATLRLKFEHSGESRILSGGHGYLFTHYRTERVNPIRWSTVYDGLTGRWTETTISAASESLLRVLLGLTAADSDAVLLYSRPGALAEIIVTKEATADNGVALDVEDLVLQLEYDYSERSRYIHELRVEANDGLRPLITVSREDLDGRTDGRGAFRRGYQGTTALRIEAPRTHGLWRFDRWEVAADPDEGGEVAGGGAAVLGTSPVLDVSLASDRSVRAVYVSTVGPEGAAIRRGDATGDGKVNISDPIATLAFLFTGGSALPCDDAGDANDDGRLDISDAVTILNYLFAGTATIPAPGPAACGADPTADGLACGAGGPCS